MTSRRAGEQALGALHALVADKLAETLAGDFTAAEMANAIRFLKDNGIEASAEPDSALGRLVGALPDFPDQPDDSLPN